MITDDKEIRQTLAQALVECARTDNRIVVLDADLMNRKVNGVSNSSTGEKR